MNNELIKLLYSLIDKPIRFKMGNFDMMTKDLIEPSIKYKMTMIDAYGITELYLKELEQGIQRTDPIDNIGFKIILNFKDYLLRQYKENIYPLANVYSVYDLDTKTLNKESDKYNSDVKRCVKNMEKEFDNNKLYVANFYIPTGAKMNYFTTYRNEVLQSVAFSNITITIL